MFLAIQPFSYNSLWFAGIYVRGSIPKLFLVRVITKAARNTAEGVKFTYFMTGNSVLVAEWPSDLHQLTESKKKN
jgi:hypothetical protein